MKQDMWLKMNYLLVTILSVCFILATEAESKPRPERSKETLLGETSDDTAKLLTRDKRQLQPFTGLWQGNLQSFDLAPAPVSSCTWSQFECADKSCIPASWKCDKIKDCDDSSDEKDCPCATDQTKCNDGECISNTWICDGIKDCTDGDDEENCMCPDGGFRCAGDGQCIAASWRCDGWDDCEDAVANEPDSDEKDCDCTMDQWKCTNGKCISKTWLCDDEADCSDAGDEIQTNCGLGCTTTEFTCQNGDCIDASMKCDGQNDCGDDSDETGCPQPQPIGCAVTEFTCPNGACISLSKKCNGQNDCGDDSDEAGCPQPQPIGCTATEFTCQNGDCIDVSKKCNGQDDCGDDSDEAGCPQPQPIGCTATEFTCQNGDCIDVSKKCNGQDDCGDDSDEAGCPQPQPIGCTATEFTCQNGDCIDVSKKCNGQDDCGDDSDEAGCPQPQPIGCSADEFECYNGQCISADKECDGKRHCSDFSDEEHCVVDPSVCTSDQISCDGTGKAPCIPLSWWCDNMNDCAGNVDETPCQDCPVPNIQCDDGRKCIHPNAACDGEFDCDDGADEPQYTEWSSWATPDGSKHCPTTCNAGSRHRERQCAQNCQLSCATDKEYTEQERVCPKIGCYTEAQTGYGSRPTNTLQSSNRIVGGELANQGEWPWQVQLFRDFDGPGIGTLLLFTCGGTLVEPDTVVTAAHCFTNKPTDPEYWVVHLGKFKRSSYLMDETDGQMMWVKKVTLHEQYNDDTSDNDIAILILGNKLTLTDTINAVALNPIDPEMRKTFDSRSECYITGWGTVEEEGQLADELQKAHVPLWPVQFCEDAFEVGFGSWITENMLCAGHDVFGIDACQGDSGGPLVCLAEDYQDGPARWYLVGVTSWGFGCANIGYPGVYARVDNYLEWIQQVRNEAK